MFTHDSIGLGEDGPTHQSVEHAASLRLIPHLDVWRPCDTVETAVAWAAAIERARRPDRAAVHAPERAVRARATPTAIAAIRRGGYVLADFDARRTGARVSSRPARRSRSRSARAKRSRGEGIAVRVVSMPCTQVFDRQDAGYRASVLPRGVPRVAVEAGVTDYWRKYVGAADDPRAAVFGLDRFGESAPGGVLFKHFGFTVENVAAAVRAVAQAGVEPQ